MNSFVITRLNIGSYTLLGFCDYKNIFNMQLFGTLFQKKQETIIKNIGKSLKHIITQIDIFSNLYLQPYFFAEWSFWIKTVKPNTSFCVRFDRNFFDKDVINICSEDDSIKNSYVCDGIIKQEENLDASTPNKLSYLSQAFIHQKSLLYALYHERKR